MLVKDIYTYLGKTPLPQHKDIGETLRQPKHYVESVIVMCLTLLKMKDEQYIGAGEKEHLEAQLKFYFPLYRDVVLNRYQEEKRDKATLPRSMGKQDVKDGLLLFLKDVDDFRRTYGIAQLTCESASLTPLHSFVRACSGQENELDLMVMAHFIWQVKRKMNGEPVIYHIMPIFYGKQGGGKSIAINKLLSPLHKLGFVLSTSLKDLADDRYFKSMSEKYVAFADEMAYPEKTQIDALKNAITADVMNPRKLATNDTFHLKQNCTFIGASNRPVIELISDPTGMRRFYEFTCQDKLDWNIINSLDYQLLWKSIDERLERGYMSESVLSQLAEAQERLIERDDVSSFISDRNLQKDLEYKSFYTNAMIWDEFQKWRLIESPTSKVTIKTIGRRLKGGLGHKQHILKINGQSTRGYYITFDKPLIDKDNVIDFNKKEGYGNK